MSEQWLAFVDARSATVAASLDAAEAAIAELAEAKREALAARDKEVRWAISAVYEYHWQHQLIEALDVTVATMSDVCDEREQDLADRIVEARAEWLASLEAGSLVLADAATTQDEECEAAQVAQTSLLAEYVDSAQVRFTTWAEGEAAALEAFIAECDEAWQVVLKSYCLDDGGHKDEDDYGHYGPGCGSRYDPYDETIPIEDQQDILQYGQDLAINSIKDAEQRIQRSVDYTLDGVSDLVTGLTEGINTLQTGIDASIAEEREYLEGALAELLAGVTATLDDIAGSLLEAQIAHDSADRSAFAQECASTIDAISVLKEQILEKIKELAWQLNWTYENGEESQELKEMIVTEKANFDLVISNAFAIFNEKAEGLINHHNVDTEATIQEFLIAVEEADAAVADATEQAMAQFTEFLADARAALESALTEATATLETRLEERLAWWNEQKDYQLKQASWTKDSYYRFHLIMLVQAKDEAVHAALEQVRSDFAVTVAAERSESQITRDEQRLDMQGTVADIRTATSTAIAADSEGLLADLEALWTRSDAFIDGEYEKLVSATDDASDMFKLSLKKIYGFGPDQYTDPTTEGGLNYGYQYDSPAQAPYKKQQEQFLWKFKQYQLQQLEVIDASLVNLKDFLGVRVLQRSDEATSQVSNVAGTVNHRRENIQDALVALGDSLIQEYEQTQAIEYQNLLEIREAVEAASEASASQMRKDIIYAVHILRYAGGKQLFGGYRQSKLTGVDELDLLEADDDYHYHDDVPVYGQPEEAEAESYPEAYSVSAGAPYEVFTDDYASSSYEELNVSPKLVLAQEKSEGGYGAKDDAHDEGLKSSIDETKAAFDLMIQAARDEYRSLVDTELAESAERLDTINNVERIPAGEVAIQELTDLCSESIATMTTDNASRAEAFIAASGDQLDAFLAQLKDQTDKVNKWFSDRLEWVDLLYNDEVKAELRVELEQKRDQALTDIEARYTDATESVAAALADLESNLSEALHVVEAFCDSEQRELSTFNDAEVSYVQETSSYISEAFVAVAEEENSFMSAALDELQRRWAWYLLKFYRYKGFDDSVYEGYTVDYADEWVEADIAAYGNGVQELSYGAYGAYGDH